MLSANCYGCSSARTAMEDERLVWIDLEMTGLFPEENRIIEIATIVTDGELNIIAEGPNLVIHQPEEELDKMDEWNVSHHTANGLIEKVRESEISEAEAESLTLEFLKEHCVEGVSPLCGNTIGQDRRFLRRYMPELHSFFHYRSVDVTTVKILMDLWYDLPPYHKNDGHRALDDIRMSVKELRYYRRTGFKEVEES